MKKGEYQKRVQLLRSLKKALRELPTTPHVVDGYIALGTLYSVFDVSYSVLLRDYGFDEEPDEEEPEKEEEEAVGEKRIGEAW